MFGAFHSGDFTGQVTLPGLGTVPRQRGRDLPVDLGMRAAPRGPNEHARPVGYGVIALAFLLADRG